MPSESLALVDTNVLVYSVFQDSEHHSASRSLLDEAQAGQLELCVTSQVLAEFYAIVTDSRRVSNPREPSEAITSITDILSMTGMVLLPMPTETVSRWVDLVRRSPCKRGAIFDYQLVASLLANGITQVYTFDRSDFERFPEIQVLVPERSEQGMQADE
jgi:predicted nucleic acid-binding protein